jgi:hypothetical protein
VATFLANTCLGAVVVVAPPVSVLPGALESNPNVFLFIESDTKLAADLAVDISTPGVYKFGVPTTPGVIKAGTTVRSYFFHRDTVATTFNSSPFLAIAPQKILGIITSDAKLDASDAILGNAGTTYPTGLAFRGLELTYPITPDTLVWAGNYITLAGILATMEVVDQFRVVTLVPEPTTCTMLAMAGAALAFVGWRRRRS